MVSLVKSALSMVGAAHLLASSIPVAAKETETRLSASGAWDMHYADDSCRLSRTFGTGEGQVLLALERFEPGDKLSLSIAGKPLKPLSSRENLSIRFGPGEAASDVHVREGSLGEWDPAFFGVTFLTGDTSKLAIERKGAAKLGIPVPQHTSAQLAAEEDERAKAIDWVSIQTGKSKQLVLDTGKMQRPLSALRTCVADLVKGWGLDPVQQANLMSGPIPKGNPGQWVRGSDYPPAMASQGKQGLIEFRLMIDAKGDVSSCHIQRSSRPASFDDTVCKIMMKRAKFDPARDSDGKPVASFWNNTVHFVIED